MRDDAGAAGQDRPVQASSPRWSAAARSASRRTSGCVGSLFVYERNAGYEPRAGGTPEWTSGPKIVHFDRVEWHVIPDPATAAGAMQAGEMDWWENPTADLLPLLQARH